MKKVLMLLVFGSFFLTGSIYAQTPAPAASPAAPAAEATAAPEAVRPAHHEHHPELRKALHKLKAAKMDLEKAAHDYGGHKAQAIADINQAMGELQAALDSDKK